MESVRERWERELQEDIEAEREWAEYLEKIQREWKIRRNVFLIVFAGLLVGLVAWAWPEPEPYSPPYRFPVTCVEDFYTACTFAGQPVEKRQR